MSTQEGDFLENTLNDSLIEKGDMIPQMFPFLKGKHLKILEFPAKIWFPGNRKYVTLLYSRGKGSEGPKARD